MTEEDSKVLNAIVDRLEDAHRKQVAKAIEICYQESLFEPAKPIKTKEYPD